MSDSKTPFNMLPAKWRSKDWSEHTRQAMRETLPEGTTGSLVLQLRERGAKAGRRANLFMWALMASITLGFLYYASLLLVPQYWNAQRSQYQAQIDILNGQMQTMTKLRDAHRQSLHDLLSFAGRPVESGTDNDLEDLRVLPDGTTLVAVGSGGTITRSTDAGDTWQTRVSGTDNRLTDLRALQDGTTLVAVGWDGTITRSTDAGDTWQTRTSGTDNNLEDLRVLPDGTTLVAAGRDGTITRSTDAGDTWQTRASGTDNNLEDLRVLPDGTTLVAAGRDGTITRSTDAGDTWQTRASGTDNGLTDLRVLPDGTTLVAAGRDGTITRSTDAGDTWQTRASGTDNGLTDLRILPDGTTLVAVGTFGTITRSTDAGDTWQTRASGTDNNLTDLHILPDGTTLVAVGWDGTITRSTDAGDTWQTRASGTDNILTDLRILPDGTTLVAVGTFGTITRSTDAGDTWQTRASGTDNILTDLRILPDGTTLVAVGQGGTIIRSTDAGDTWQTRASGTDNTLTDLRILTDGTTLVAVGWTGTIIQLDDSLSRSLESVPTAPSSSADQALVAFFATLPGNLPTRPEVSQLRTQIVSVTANRAKLVQDHLAASAALAEISTGGFSLSQRRLDFDLFMASCHPKVTAAQDGTPTPAPDKIAEVTKACADAYAAQRLTESKSWWATVAETGPPAILLLFLLATLGGLFRYNLRLAGFHHSRADALELLASYEHKDHLDTLTKIADALAADKVEFGKGNTPSDQAVDMFKAFAARSGK